MKIMFLKKCFDPKSKTVEIIPFPYWIRGLETQKYFHFLFRKFVFLFPKLVLKVLDEMNIMYLKKFLQKKLARLVET